MESNLVIRNFLVITKFFNNAIPYHQVWLYNESISSSSVSKKDHRTFVWLLAARNSNHLGKLKNCAEFRLEFLLGLSNFHNWDRFQTKTLSQFQKDRQKLAIQKHFFEQVFSIQNWDSFWLKIPLSSKKVKHWHWK